MTQESRPVLLRLGHGVSTSSIAELQALASVAEVAMVANETLSDDPDQEFVGVLPVRAEDGALGFDLDGPDGAAQIRFDSTVIFLEGAAWTDEGKVRLQDEGSIGPDNWRPWLILQGPGAVKGTRFATVGAAVRAVLRAGHQGSES